MKCLKRIVIAVLIVAAPLVAVNFWTLTKLAIYCGGACR
jgi:hypothetical protein